MCGDVTTVDQMLRNGMPVDVSGVNGCAALHLATSFNQTDIIKHLLHEGADVNIQRRDDKETPLHTAARANYTEVARMLIDNGADVNLTKENNTPLDVARKGSEVERLLVQLQQSAP